MKILKILLIITIITITTMSFMIAYDFTLDIMVWDIQSYLPQ